MGSLYKRGNVWWLKYYVNGRPVRESSGSTKRSLAVRLLKEREGKVVKGEPISLRADRILVDEALQDLLDDYRVNERKSLERAEVSVKRLIECFGGRRVNTITTEDIKRFVASRQQEKTKLGKPPSNASLNRELACLKRALNLAAKATPPKLYRVPHIPMLEERNVRKGFFEREEFLAVRAAAPDYLKPLITAAYYTGMRKGELLGLRWNQVNLHERTIQLHPQETKNEEARKIFMPEALYQCLSAQRMVRDFQYPDCPFVFFRDGKHIRSFRDAWNKACQDIGLEGRLFHDLRRTAVRNLIRCGVSEAVAMRISGHKTRSVFSRYNIVSESDLVEAAQALNAFEGTAGTVLGTIEGAEQILEKVQRGE